MMDKKKMLPLSSTFATEYIALAVQRSRVYSAGYSCGLDKQQNADWERVKLLLEMAVSVMRLTANLRNSLSPPFRRMAEAEWKRRVAVAYATEISRNLKETLAKLGYEEKEVKHLLAWPRYLDEA